VSVSVKGRSFRGGGSSTDRPAPGGRRPPAEWTGHEAEYLDSLRDLGTPLRVRLRDGRTVFGVIEYYDRDMLKLQRPAGPHLLLRKSDIRTLQEEPAAG
jgi:hypothetical protein